MALFNLMAGVVGAIASAIAAVTGFGIGSLLTPLFSLQFETKLAVAIVSIPHLIGTLVRLGSLWRRIDRPVVLAFGALSAVGSFAGAMVAVRRHDVMNPVLTIIFACLLIFAGASVLFHFTERVRFGRTAAAVVGAVSGFFGGLVGNQGGIRSAALLGFEITKESFIATAMAIAVVVDLARIPVYVATQGPAMSAAWIPMLCATIGVLIGTLWGGALLRRIPIRTFRAGVALLVLLLGVAMLITPLRRAL